MTLTHDDLQSIGALVNTAINEAVKPLATKEDVTSSKMELYDELNLQYNENDKRFAKLENIGDKIDTLLLQSDNTALLLKLAPTVITTL